VFLNSYGWYNWYKSESDSKELIVTDSGNLLWLWIISSIIGTMGLAFIMYTYTNASLPYPDSYIAVTSLIAQWLMAKKKLESWYFWIMTDVTAIFVYWQKELYLTTILYAFFLILAMIGYWEWRNTFLKNKLIQTVE